MPSSTYAVERETFNAMRDATLYGTGIAPIVFDEMPVQCTEIDGRLWVTSTSPEPSHMVRINNITVDPVPPTYEDERQAESLLDVQELALSLDRQIFNGQQRRV